VLLSILPPFRLAVTHDINTLVTATMKMFGSMFGSRRAGKVDNVPSSTTDRDDTHVSSGEAVTSRKRSDSIDSDHKVKVEIVTWYPQWRCSLGS